MFTKDETVVIACLAGAMFWAGLEVGMWAMKKPPLEVKAPVAQVQPVCKPVERKR